MTPDVSDPGGLRRFSDNGSWHGLQADPSLSGTGLLVVIAAAFFLASKARAGELDTACTFREAANFPAGEIGWQGAVPRPLKAWVPRPPRSGGIASTIPLVT